MTELFNEPSRGIPRSTPTAREWALAMVKVNNVRVVNRTDSDASSIHLVHPSHNRESYTNEHLRTACESLARQGLIERGIPAVTHTSKTYLLQLTREGKKAHREQVYRIGVAQGPTPTPSVWWLLLTLPFSLFGLILSIASYSSSLDSPLDRTAWESTSVAISMTLAFVLLTWRIYEAQRVNKQRKLYLILAWIIPTCVAFNYVLLWLLLRWSL